MILHRGILYCRKTSARQALGKMKAVAYSGSRKRHIPLAKRQRNCRFTINIIWPWRRNLTLVFLTLILVCNPNINPRMRYIIS